MKRLYSKSVFQNSADCEKCASACESICIIWIYQRHRSGQRGSVISIDKCTDEDEIWQDLSFSLSTFESALTMKTWWFCGKSTILHLSVFFHDELPSVNPFCWLTSRTHSVFTVLSCSKSSPWCFGHPALFVQERRSAPSITLHGGDVIYRSKWGCLWRETKSICLRLHMYSIVPQVYERNPHVYSIKVMHRLLCKSVSLKCSQFDLFVTEKLSLAKNVWRNLQDNTFGPDEFFIEYSSLLYYCKKVQWRCATFIRFIQVTLQWQIIKFNVCFCLV